jgi:uncharacterized membrane protein YkoI
MKIKNLICSLMAIGLVAGGLAACATHKEEGEAKEAKQAKLEAEAKVPKAQAEKTALARVPGGAIKEGELEKEKGKLIWSFDISTPGTKDITEVQVNAISGEVVSVATEPAAGEKPEGKEKKGKKEKEEDEKDEKK